MKCIHLPAQEAGGIQPHSRVRVPSAVASRWGCGLGGKGRAARAALLPAPRPRRHKPQMQTFYNAAIYCHQPGRPHGLCPGPRTPCGHRWAHTRFAPNFSLRLLLASSQVWCSEHGTSPRETSQRFGSMKIPAAGKSLSPRQASSSPALPTPRERQRFGGRQGRGCAAPAAAWEYLLMPQECGYVMASPPHALPLPRSHPPAQRGSPKPRGSIVPAEIEA